MGGCCHGEEDSLCGSFLFVALIPYQLYNRRADAYGAAAPRLRKEKIDMLEQAFLLEETNLRLAGIILGVG